MVIAVTYQTLNEGYTPSLELKECPMRKPARFLISKQGKEVMTEKFVLPWSLRLRRDEVNVRKMT